MNESRMDVGAPAITLPMRDFGWDVRNQLRISIAVGTYFENDKAQDSITEREAVDQLDYLSRLNLAQAVNSFQTYLTNLLTLIFSLHPRALFKRQVSAELVFRSDDISDLRRLFVETEVRDLAYKSVTDLATYIEDKIGLRIFETPFQAARVQRLFLLRNLITHSRGVVHRQFLSQTRSKKYKVGDQLQFKVETPWIGYLLMLASRIDARAVEKFSFADSDLLQRVTDA